MIVPRGGWRWVELAPVADRSRASSPRQLVKKVIDWQVHSRALVCCVLAGSKPRIVTDALPQISRLAASGARGFELILASSMSDGDFRAFLDAEGYAYSCDDDPSAAPGGDRYEAALKLAMTLDVTTLCVFAHDANPIWILAA